MGQNFNPNDIFSQMFQGQNLDDLFRQAFGNQMGRQRQGGHPMDHIFANMMQGMASGQGGTRVFRSANGATTFSFTSFGGPQ